MSFSTYLPSRKFFLSLLGIGVACVITLVLVQLIDKNNILVPSDRSALVIDDATVEQFQEFSQLDTDSDGLKDWEESLWETDPNNPDTDGDGNSDFNEIAAEKDRINIEAESDPSLLISEEDLTNTDIFARDLFTTVSVLDQQGALENNTDLIKQQIAQSVTSIALYKPFTFADIKLVDTNDTTVAEYLENIEDIFTRYPYDEEDLLLILNTSIKEDISNADDISSINMKYESFVKELESMNVPVAARDIHLGLINAWRHYIGITQAFTNTQSDPLLSMAATQQVQSVLDDIILAYRNFYTVFFQ